MDQNSLDTTAEPILQICREEEDATFTTIIKASSEELKLIDIYCNFSQGITPTLVFVAGDHSN